MGGRAALDVHTRARIFGLAKVLRVAPRLKLDCAKLDPDLDTLQSVITHRYAVVVSYARSVKQTYSVEAARQRARILNGGLL